MLMSWRNYNFALWLLYIIWKYISTKFFFMIMAHLVIHLVEKAKIAGLVILSLDVPNLEVRQKLCVSLINYLVYNLIQPNISNYVNRYFCTLMSCMRNKTHSKDRSLIIRYKMIHNILFQVLCKCKAIIQSRRYKV